jgi:hypothetical protein
MPRLLGFWGLCRRIWAFQTTSRCRLGCVCIICYNRHLGLKREADLIHLERVHLKWLSRGRCHMEEPMQYRSAEYRNFKRALLHRDPTPSLPTTFGQGLMPGLQAANTDTEMPLTYGEYWQSAMHAVHGEYWLDVASYYAYPGYLLCRCISGVDLRAVCAQDTLWGCGSQPQVMASKTQNKRWWWSLDIAIFH